MMRESPMSTKARTYIDNNHLDQPSTDVVQAFTALNRTRTRSQRPQESVVQDFTHLKRLNEPRNACPMLLCPTVYGEHSLSVYLPRQVMKRESQA